MNIGRSIQNYLVIEVSYYGATNTRGSRVKLYAPRLKEKVFIPFDYARNDIEAMAMAYLDTIGHEIDGRAEYGDKFILLSKPIFNRFQSIKGENPKKFRYILKDYTTSKDIDGVRYETEQDAYKARERFLSRMAKSGEVHNNLIIIQKERRAGK